MPRIGINITKSTLFRGKTQEFHNTYFYNSLAAVTIPSEGLVDEIVTTEKNLHGGDVNFLRAQVWTAGGTPAQNNMIFQKNLTGAGNQANGPSMDRERAVLIRWPAGVDVRGKPVFLRKWYHVCGAPAGVSLTTAGILENKTAIPDANRTTIANLAEQLREIGNIEGWQLCAKSGRLSEGGAQCHPYLEHHQLGDMWR